MAPWRGEGRGELTAHRAVTVFDRALILPHPALFRARTANCHRPLRRVGCHERALGLRTEDLTVCATDPWSLSR